MKGFPPAVGPRFRLGGVDLAGAYGAAEREYQALRNGCGLIDLTHLDWITLTGPDATEFLQGMVTQDVAGLTRSRPALILDPGGKIVTPLTIHPLAANEFLLQLPAGYGEPVYDHLNRFLIMEEAVLARRPDLGCFSILGPQAGDFVKGLQDRPGLLRCVPNQRIEQGGFDVVYTGEEGPAWVDQMLTSGAVPVGMRALNTARIESFLPWFEMDIQTGLNPLIFGLKEYISDRKGCYVGQETVAMTRDRGRPPRLMVQLLGQDDRIPAAGTALLLEGRAAGELSSSTYSPQYGKVIGIGILKYAVATGLAKTLSDPTGRTWTILKTSLASKSS